MPYLGDFLPPEKAVEWSELQDNLSPDCGLEDVSGFTENPMQKTAANVPDAAQSELDVAFADSGLLNEKLECTRHIKRLTDEEKLPYPVIEKSLKQLGYRTPIIRTCFFEHSGIDPVEAYLDASNYPKPPGAVPTYNYGWGEAKSGSDHFFILPWTDKYAVFKLKGLNRELDSEHYLLKDAREALSKKVKALTDVEPNGADVLSQIIQRVAAVVGLSPKGADLYKQLQKFDDPNDIAKTATYELDEGRITPKDFQIIANNLVLAAPSQSLLNPGLMTAPERVDEREFREFREEQENRSFQEMRDNTLMPGQEFASNWQSKHKVDFWGLLSKSRELFSELSSTVDGFKVEPSWGTFRIMPSPSLAVDDENHILDGSVAVGATVERIGPDKDQAEAVLLFFIHNGKLKYSGKFKGVNDREYAFTTMGLQDYFDDLEGSTALDEEISKGPTNTPGDMMENGPGSMRPGL